MMAEIEFVDDEGTKLARRVELGTMWVKAYFALGPEENDAHYRYYPVERIREVRTRDQGTISLN